MKVIYLAHPLGSGPDREDNRRNAAEWAAWIACTFSVAVSADWIWMSGVLEETPENRALGIATDLELVTRADELWMVGPRVSEGMRAEFHAAMDAGKTVRDFTRLSRAHVLLRVRAPL